MSGAFAQVGFCKTLGGSTKAPIITGLGTAVLVGVGVYVMAADPKPPIYTLIGTALLVGGIVAAITYFTCSGVEIGIPIKRR